jgi:hypothetical protein
MIPGNPLVRLAGDDDLAATTDRQPMIGLR